MLIAVCGRAKSGKDEFFKQANKMFPELSFYRSYFSLEVKKIAASIIFGSTSFYDQFNDHEVKESENFIGVTNRELLVAIGDGIRQYIPDIWIKQIYLPAGRNIIITDMRYPNEANFVRSKGGLVVKVKRDSDDLIPTESSVDEIKPDIEIDNNSSLEDYKKQIELIIRSL